MSDSLVPISGSWGAAECLVCGHSWKLTGPIETQMPRCPRGCYSEALQGVPLDATAERDAQITALRAALDQERADSAKLRMIFDVMGNNAYCGEVPLDVLIDYGVPEEELDRLLNGPRIDDLPRVSPPTETDLARALEQVRQLTNEVDDLRGWIAAAKKAAAPISALLSGRGEAS